MSKKTIEEESKWQKLAENAEEDIQEGTIEEPEAPELNYSSREDLETQLNALDQKYNEAITALRYTQAEFDNFRKRSEREVDNAYKYGPKKLLNELLTILDSFEKTLETLNEKEIDFSALKEGLTLTHKMLLNTLEKFSVKQLNPVGETFNPTWHEAMTMQEKEGCKSGTVIAVLQKGYILHEQLLRPALVIVAK